MRDDLDVTVGVAVLAELDAAGLVRPPVRWGRRARWEHGEVVIDDDGDEER